MENRWTLTTRSLDDAEKVERFFHKRGIETAIHPSLSFLGCLVEVFQEGKPDTAMIRLATGVICSLNGGRDAQQ